MAQRTVVQLTDDIDGSEAAETISFAFEGVDYEIDLNETNAANFREMMASYMGAGRQIPGAGRSSRRSSVRSSKRESHAIRAWAQENGHEVSARGRISRDVVEAYELAQAQLPLERRARRVSD